MHVRFFLNKCLQLNRFQGVGKSGSSWSPRTQEGSHVISENFKANIDWEVTHRNAHARLWNYTTLWNSDVKGKELKRGVYRCIMTCFCGLHLHTQTDVRGVSCHFFQILQKYWNYRDWLGIGSFRSVLFFPTMFLEIAVFLNRKGLIVDYQARERPVEHLCDHCFRAISYTLYYVRLCH